MSSISPDEQHLINDGIFDGTDVFGGSVSNAIKHFTTISCIIPTAIFSSRVQQWYKNSKHNPKEFSLTEKPEGMRPLTSQYLHRKCYMALVPNLRRFGRKSRKVSRKSRKVSRKSRKVSRKSRKVSRKSRKVSRKSRKSRKVSRKVSRKSRKSRKVSRKKS